MFVCKVCGKEVKAGQAFCPTCGADVVENHETICPVCNTKNSAGSKYCAKCGGILHTLRKPVCSECGAKNLPGAKFCVSCGAPIKPEVDTHSDADMIDARKAKRRVDNMERERMAAVDREIARKKAFAADEIEKQMQEIDDYRAQSEKEFEQKKKNVELYKDKLNELGAEDVDMLKKMSTALKDYSQYYADPYSQVDEDDIQDDVYVCPACGTINPKTATTCSNCGRNRARAQLLLAKGKIKQSPPVKRKKDVIAAPEADLERLHVPTYDEFVKSLEEKPVEKDEHTEQKQEGADFSGPHYNPYGQYPYPPYPYPYPPYPYPPYPYGCGCCNRQENKANKPCEQPEESPKEEPCATCEQKPVAEEQRQNVASPYQQFQMPPIVQPVAFVPYVSQEQPLMQYAPAVEEQPRKRAIPVAQPVAQSVARPAKPGKRK